MQNQLTDKNTLKQFIANNRLNETIMHLNRLLNNFLDNNKNHIDYGLISKFLNALIINSGKLNNLEQDRIIGLIDRDTQRITMAEVQQAVLYIIDQLPEQFWNFIPPTEKTESVVNTVLNKNTETNPLTEPDNLNLQLLLTGNKPGNNANSFVFVQKMLPNVDFYYIYNRNFNDNNINIVNLYLKNSEKSNINQNVFLKDSELLKNNVITLITHCFFETTDNGKQLNNQSAIQLNTVFIVKNNDSFRVLTILEAEITIIQNFIQIIDNIKNNQPDKAENLSRIIGDDFLIKTVFDIIFGNSNEIVYEYNANRLLIDCQKYQNITDKDLILNQCKEFYTAQSDSINLKDQSLLLFHFKNSNFQPFIKRIFSEITRKLNNSKNERLRNVNFIINELIQNAQDHSIKVSALTGTPIVFVLIRDTDKNVLTVGNYIDKTLIEKIDNIIYQLNLSDEEKLNLSLEQNIANCKTGDHKDNGLGLIEVRLRSKSLLYLNCTEINEKLSFIDIKVLIDFTTSRKCDIISNIMPLYINGTDDSPSVELDPNKNKFEIAGQSWPQDAVLFYMPVIKWLNEYFNITGNDFFIDFKFDYCNTATFKQLAKILSIIEKHSERANVLVRWHYNPEDTDMYRSGKRYSKMMKFKVELIECL